MTDIPLYIQQFIVLGVTLLLIIMLFYEKVKPSFLFFSAVLVFQLTGIIGTKDFLASLSNDSVLSIFLLIFITAGLREHFNIVGFLDRIFGRSNTPKSFMLRMTSGVTALSAFLNNTPIVAMIMPYVYQWSKKNNIAPSKLLIPLSYAAITGGMITVIGTSTNLVLNGLIATKGVQPLGFTDYFIPGTLVSLGGIAFLYFFGYRLLPDRNYALNKISEHTREYLVETKVAEGSSLAGKSVIEANLRNLTGIYLFEIVRQGRIITPVDPTEVLYAGDSLFFAGETNTIKELLSRENELTLPASPNTRVSGEKGYNLIETVIPVNSELVGRTLKQVEFRENYDAAVVAIHRNGEKLRGKIGELEMQAGDLLMVSAGHNFSQLLKSRPNLYVVSTISKITDSKPAARKGFIAFTILAIAAVVLGYASLFMSLLLITSFMVVTGLLSISEIKKEMDIDLLIILISSLTFSKAIIDTGSAEMVANSFLAFFHGFGNAGILTGLFIITLLLTSFVTHVAAISIIFPITFALGQSVPGISMKALFLAIAFAASASFHSPFSYQTNLMVYGPGGYKFKDFLKIGLPFTAVYSVITLAFIILYYHV